MRVLVFTNDAGAVFQSAVIRGATAVLDAAGRRVEVVEVGPQAPASALPRGVGAADGALVLASALSEPALRELWRSAGAVTLVSHLASEARVPAVLHDNAQGMRQLVEHLVACGRRSFVYVRGDVTQVDGRQREEAFREEVLRHGLEVGEDDLLEGGFVPEVARASVARLARARDDFDAVVAADYLMAIAAVEELRSAGVAVPGRVSVVGFGDGPEASTAGLTVVAADVEELGRRAARQLVAQLEGGRLTGYTLLSTRLVVRATSAP